MSCMYIECMETQKVSECRIALTMSVVQLAELDAYCVEMRKETGEPIARAEVIRMAIAEKLARLR